MASDLKGDPTTGEDMETRYKICHFHRFAYMAERCLLCEMQEAIDRTAAQNRALLAALEDAFTVIGEGLLLLEQEEISTEDFTDEMAGLQEQTSAVIAQAKVAS